MRKRKKIVRSIVLFALLISTLLGVFTVSSSAASYDQLYINHVPNKLYYLYGNSPQYSTAYWNTPTLTANDRIAFYVMSSGSGLWHLAPFVQGQESIDSSIQYYNDDIPPVSVQKRMAVMSRLMTGPTWETWIRYSTRNDGFEVILRLSDGAVESFKSSDIPWKPMYVIHINFIDRDGKFSKIVPEGTAAVMSTWAEGWVKHDETSTRRYPFIDCGVLLRYFYSNINGDVKGINMEIEEYFYNNDGNPYPTLDGDFDLNLIDFYYDGSYRGARFVSYPIRYYFEDEGFELRQQYAKGYAAGQSEGYESGRLAGINAGENYNAVDGILSLAQVPGFFISSMLDFDFFGINLANGVKVLFTIIVIAFLLVFLLKFIL